MNSNVFESSCKKHNIQFLKKIATGLGVIPVVVLQILYQHALILKNNSYVGELSNTPLGAR